MLVRNLSLASALTLVGLGLFANAVVHLATNGQGRAFAEERTVEAASAALPVNVQPPVPRSLGEDGALSRNGATTMAAGTAPCWNEGEPQHWFGAIRELPACGEGTFPRSPAYLRFGGGVGGFDVDADGDTEFLHSSTISGFELISGGVPQPNGCVVYRDWAIDEGERTTIRRECVLDSDPLLQWVLSMPAVRYASAFPAGFRDFDGDGDLDLLVVLFVPEANRYVWLENTGFEATRPLAGDLNSDGNVDSADLTMLLGGWTGN